MILSFFIKKTFRLYYIYKDVNEPSLGELGLSKLAYLKISRTRV
jgi:hypothetical protein